MHDFRSILNGLMPILSASQLAEVESHIEHGDPVSAMEFALRCADDNVTHVPRTTFLQIKEFLETHGSDRAHPIFLNPIERTDLEMRAAMHGYANGARQILGLLDPYLTPGSKSSLEALIEEGAFHGAITLAVAGLDLPKDAQATVDSYVKWCELENRFTG